MQYPIQSEIRCKEKYCKIDANLVKKHTPLHNMDIIKQLNALFENLLIDYNSIKSINTRVVRELCQTTIDCLNDTNLLEEYKSSKSVQLKLLEFKTMLENYNIDNGIVTKILDEYTLKLVPSGTKGVIRGNKFNSIVKHKILKHGLDDEKFEIMFERQSPVQKMDEIPDWYILERSTNKLLIGMNQLDLWNGGHQLNRGFKYLKNTHLNTPAVKILCVVCNKIKLKSKKNKVYELFHIGYTNDTLCYINNLCNIIDKFFTL